MVCERGRGETVTSTPVYDHTFASGGTYNIKLEKRSEGGTPANVTHSVGVTGSPLTAYIGGPTWINHPGNYTWTAYASGGSPPYTYQWWYKKLAGGSWQLMSGATAASYTRYVGYSDEAFRLRVYVTDATGAQVIPSIAVDMPWGP